MTSITATTARKDIYRLIDQVNAESTPVSITSTKGKGAVLVGEDDWAAIEETLALASIPGMVETLMASHAESLEECVDESELDW
ncbi:type II toxin-antitoxin system Phd/YefM family antitoxin [Curtanaerobium respiraculi]|jgi:prevent-host-death family protein|uniref:type II toxin-antitoxin system Phd/YefM family antitoxin n=1 Tax=Curtanaerobium respiraculi TaxID=2949669 RepID=UPI0024B37346|nr:type II toxin-antitoxin system Phd/YefM family antitoxin [Curtanaerobium respiraculi]